MDLCKDVYLSGQQIILYWKLLKVEIADKVLNQTKLYVPCLLTPLTSPILYHFQGRNRSVGSVLGSLSCAMQRQGFNPLVEEIFPWS